MKVYGIEHAAMCPTTEIMIHRTHVIYINKVCCHPLAAHPILIGVKMPGHQASPVGVPKGAMVRPPCGRGAPWSSISPKVCS